jgi:hypothetical protein
VAEEANQTQRGSDASDLTAAQTAAPAPVSPQTPDATPTSEQNSQRRPALATLLQGLLVVVILGIVADLTGVLGFFGIDFAALWPFRPVTMEVTLVRAADCAVRSYALPAPLDPAADPAGAAEALRRALAGVDAPAWPTVDSPLLAFQITNRTPGAQQAILSNRGVVTVTAVALSQEHVHAVTLEPALGCASAWVQRLAPDVPLRRDLPIYTQAVVSPADDYFALAEGDFERFSLALPCATPGAYQATASLTYEFGAQRGAVTVGDAAPRLCPAAYTLWQVDAAGQFVEPRRFTWDGAHYQEAEAAR